MAVSVVIRSSELWLSDKCSLFFSFARVHGTAGVVTVSIKTNVVAVQVATIVDDSVGSRFASILRFVTLTMRDSRLNESKKNAKL